MSDTAEWDDFEDPMEAFEDYRLLLRRSHADLSANSMEDDDEN